MSGLLPVAIDEVFHLSFNVKDPVGGGLVDADSTPTCAIFEEDTDTAIRTPTVVKRSALTGTYRVSDTLSTANGYEEGKWYNVEISATVNSVLQKKPIGQFYVGPIEANIVQIAGTAANAIALGLSTGQMTSGTVEDTTTTPTTTSFAASDITEATADHYNNRVVMWVTGNLTGSVAAISAYTLTSGEGVFTVSEMQDTPADGDTFILL
jgi:hypothetical protein